MIVSNVEGCVNGTNLQSGVVGGVHEEVQVTLSLPIDLVSDDINMLKKRISIFHI